VRGKSNEIKTNPMYVYIYIRERDENHSLKCYRPLSSRSIVNVAISVYTVYNIIVIIIMSVFMTTAKILCEGLFFYKTKKNIIIYMRTLFRTTYYPTTADRLQL